MRILLAILIVILIIIGLYYLLRHSLPNTSLSLLPTPTPVPTTIYNPTPTISPLPTLVPALTALSPYGHFNYLNKALSEAGMNPYLNLVNVRYFTAFVPSDTAFNNLPAATRQQLLNDPARLKKIMFYYVVPTKITSGDINTTYTAVNLAGTNLTLTPEHADFQVNGIPIVHPDIPLGHGIVHIIDRFITLQ